MKLRVIKEMKDYQRIFDCLEKLRPTASIIEAVIEKLYRPTRLFTDIIWKYQVILAAKYKYLRDFYRVPLNISIEGMAMLNAEIDRDYPNARKQIDRVADSY